MPSYHSRIKNSNPKITGNMPILTFQTNFNGPVTSCINEDLTEPIKSCPERMDIIEEAIYYFRGNVFLSKFEIKTPVDRLLIYLTFYILECLKKISKTCVIKKQAQLAMLNFARDKVWMNEEDSNHILNFVYKKPEDEKEAVLEKLSSSIKIGNWSATVSSGVRGRKVETFKMVDMFCEKKVSKLESNILAWQEKATFDN